jgi:phosphonate transport system ATP-binding protein
MPVADSFFCGSGLPAATGTVPLLATRNLHVQRGGRDVLHNVTFALPPGEFVAVIGRSGTGKTTLLHTLAGLIAPTTGTVNWSDSRRALLFQHYRLVPQLAALTNVLCGRLGACSWWQTLTGFPAADRARAAHWLAAVGLADKADQPARCLSGGEQQRVALARALIQEPAVLLADEPVASLDAETTHEMMDLLAELNRSRGLTVLTVLHDLELAERYADRVLLLDAGCLVYDGPARNLTGLVRDRLQWKTL